MNMRAAITTMGMSASSYIALVSGPMIAAGPSRAFCSAAAEIRHARTSGAHTR
jgi:hypothetical protein